MSDRLQVSRRRFVTGTAATLAWGTLGQPRLYAEEITVRPRILSTWPFGQPANDAALAALQQGASGMDAVERGIRVVENDAGNTSVGLGGIPNADGTVQLDACVMEGPGHRAGSVAGLEDILHPISVARRVMDETPHVMLVGAGARQFAIEQGFQPTELLTEERRQAWQKWRQARATEDKSDTTPPRPDATPENHDTIALVLVDAQGNLYGGCSTSGWGYKVPGRVGDSPILGSGLYVDNEVGAAGATGIGENVMRYCASFMIVESMRQGMSPQEACEAAIRRIARQDPKSLADLHINFIALDKQGRCGAAGTDENFRYAVTDDNQSDVLTALHVTD